ncbi:PREDICTED: nuclear receptor subfamily 0 group B member 1 [Nanorana parkeri]|uniref:nuclear receptor subfamily 0 group B member 1 n=1 Tax=Nanorana parkeri TaxID=125878 RepID=UPI000854A5A7|nr:PREDICTED: nuclear receptor subfamily 0 group B member 1 [Nanorana parkeri]
MAFLDKCHCAVDNRRHGSILYNILKNEEHRDSHHSSKMRKEDHSRSYGQGCSCGSQKKVTLKSPQVTCKAASAVLVKTLRFVKSVPCFQELPMEDQLLLVRSCWAPLLVLGLAQDKVDFETVETSEPSMLQRILTNRQGGERKLPHEHAQQDLLIGNSQHQQQTKLSQLPSATEIRWIKEFLEKCWSLAISTKEYVYLKGIVLFNPDLPGLHCAQYIQGLQQEANQALNEHVKTIQRWDHARFTKLIIVLSLLRSVNANAISELFFRPIIGTVNMDDMLLEMLGAKI